MENLCEAAIETLRLCSTESGLKASGGRKGHHQIWARDSMIALLGARTVRDAEIHRTLRASVETLRLAQSATGAIPNNVDVETGCANFRAYADAGLWWIVGSALLGSGEAGKGAIGADLAATRAVLAWCEFQDADHSGLLSMHEGADWQDLFCTRGKGLYLNCLYVTALRSAARIAAVEDPNASAEWLGRADRVAQRMRDLFWYAGDGNMLRHIAHSFSTIHVTEHDSLGRKRWVPAKRHLKDEPHFLPYLGFRAAGEWFDCLGNLLAILSGVANEEQSCRILEFISRYGLNRHPLPAIYPPVEPGDADWRDYYDSLNVPGHYHNGGIWPFIGGFYVAALVRCDRMDEAREAFERLGELNATGQFNEWHSGITGKPMGVEHQAWSAGMYLFAAECVQRGCVDVF